MKQMKNIEKSNNYVWVLAWFLLENFSSFIIITANYKKN